MKMFSLKNRKKDEKKQEEKNKKLEDKRKTSSKMNDFPDDFDLGPESPIRKVDSYLEKKNSVLDLISDFSSEICETSGPQVPPRTRKTAGWAEDTPAKRSWLRRGSKSFSRDSRDSLQKEMFVDTTTSVATNEIPIIPDLDDMKEEELSADVAKAPNIAVSKIATFQELNSDLSKHAAFQSLDGIDLTLLTKRLLPEHLLKKEDEVSWTWDTLFADVSSHLNATMSNDQKESNIDKLSECIDKIL